MLALNGPPFGRIAYGIAVEKGNSTLQTEIDSALRDLIASGELRNVLSRWGLWTDTVAQAFNQPAKPSASDSEYQAFVANQGGQTKFWSRIHIYAAAGRLLRRAALLTLTGSITAMAVAGVAGFCVDVGSAFCPPPRSWVSTGRIERVRRDARLEHTPVVLY